MTKRNVTPKNAVLLGTSVQDTIIGGSGSQKIRGLGGDDTLFGGSGADVFIFESTFSANGVDTISDYTPSKKNNKSHSSNTNDELDLSAVFGSLVLSKLNVSQYIRIHNNELLINKDGVGNDWEVWAKFDNNGSAEGGGYINQGDLIRIKTKTFCGDLIATKDSQPPADTTAPSISSQSLGYNEGQAAGVSVGSLVASDNVSVTQYRFVYADNTTTGAISEDGWFEVDSSGNIKITASGAASAANNYSIISNTHVYKMQAGDAAGNWSTAVDVTLNEQDVADTVAPALSAQSFNFNENQITGATVASVVATDNDGVTQYRFVYADNTTTSNTSEDGWFEIDSSGNIKMTASGFTSIANNFEALTNSHTYKVQAGDAAGNWSSVVDVTLSEQDVAATPGFLIYSNVQDWYGSNDILSVWVPSDSNGSYNPQSTGDWSYYKNGTLIADPDSYPIPYTNGNWQGQVQWSGTSDTLVTGDVVQIVAVVNGITYETPLYTIL